MKPLRTFAILLMIGAFGVLLFAPVGMAAQKEAKDQSNLTLKQVKERLKQNKQYLKEAAKHGKAGDTAGLETALANYDRGMEGLNTAFSKGQFRGSHSQQESAYQRLQNATSKHLNVLNKLLSKVPAQAVPHIQHAIAVSKTGEMTALNHLVQLDTQGNGVMESNPDAGRSRGMDHPEGAGQPGGIGGVGPGNAPMGGPMGGAMGPPGGGPPMGGNPGR